ncbi:nuclear transport factor 2 family protein [Paenibacillus psychroresistens]|uniref:Nuclear transport factor 2 family protein n=1 Tax=Paenibacillus psychroresistens TaxID=1778678 RepID=A0A6B8RNY5_9BACL|nr:nuclear transport factor 2 family protein [Paenibacillus psychroresistens]QGQ97729.1 nuclear transport factor 2 family protein [Paenibacillus psychroresistens]
MQILDDYFRLFDDSRSDHKAKEQLLDLFTPDAEIVLNGFKKVGFEGFINAYYENNIDVKHMWEKWELKENGTYETNWAVCGKSKDGNVYAKTGIDIAELNDDGKIIYLENVQADKNAFKKYE